MFNFEIGLSSLTNTIRKSFSLKKDLNIHWVVIYRLFIVLFLFLFCRLIFYFIYRDLFPGIELNSWKVLLSGGFKFDLVACLYSNAIVVLITLYPALSRYSFSYQKFVRWVFIVFNTFAILLNSIDFVAYRFTLRRISSDVIKEFSNEEGKFVFFFQCVIDFWYVVILFLVLVGIVVWLYDRVNIILPVIHKPKLFYFGSTAVYLFVITAIIFGIRGDFKHSSRPLTNSDAGEYVRHPHEIPLVLNSVFCFVRTMSLTFYRKEEFFTVNDVEKIYSPVQKFKSDATFKRMNVMIILLESFGKESIGFYNRHLDNESYKGYTPFLDSLCSVGRVCINSFANGRKSVDAMPAVLAGIPKAEIPFILTPYVSNKLNSLPKILRDSGYSTSFFHGAPNGSMGFKSFTKLVGIDRYYGMTEYNHDEDFDGLWGIYDEPFFKFTASTIDTIQKPFFATLFSLSSHHPFKLPKHYEGVFKEGVHPIHKCLSYSDHSLQLFFEELKSKSWFDNTLFVIAADHATITQRPEYNTSWGKMSIPIILYNAKDTSLNKIDSSIIQHTDIAPSVLHYLNYSGTFVSFGKSIFDANRKNYAAGYLDDFYWIEGEFLLQFKNKKASSIYNYINDPLLSKNLIQDSLQLENFKSMNNSLKAYIQQFHNRMIEDRLIE